MKVRCDRRALLDRLSLTTGITANRGTRPILQYVLMTVEESKLILRATDLELSLQCSLQVVSADEPGQVALPAARLLSILREANGETVDLSTDGSLALLRASGSQFRLSGEDPGSFPEFPDSTDVVMTEIPAATVRELAERTQFAASKELGRYAINGILVEFEEKTMRFVSTDGRRLAMAESVLETEAQSSIREILPLKGVVQFLKAVGPDVETVGLGLKSRRVFLRCEDLLLAANSVEADFPDFHGVINVNRTSTVSLDRELFFSCVRQAAVMAGEDVHAVTLRFSEGSLVVSASVEGLGDARSEMSVDYVGEETEVAFNPDFLLDFSKVPMPDQLPIQFKDASVSVIFRPFENFCYVVMPIST